MLINQVMISNQVKIRDICTANTSKTLKHAPEQSDWTHGTTGKKKIYIYILIWQGIVP